MRVVSIRDITQAIERGMVTVLGIAVLLALILSVVIRNRDSMADIPLPLAPIADSTDGVVTATWFGCTTLLFDDGETQILVDAFISRPTVTDYLLRRPVENDIATINYFMHEYRVRRLAAIIPLQSHYDHAMDIGAIANRSNASILGSESSAQIGRGAGVPEDQIVVIGDGAEYQFGQFTVRFIESDHAPTGWRGSVPFAGTIDAPLETPAPISAWREGGSYVVVISHPTGTALVQGTAGMAKLEELNVDVAFLGVGMLSGLGGDYAERFWHASVTSTGADVVIPIEFDDFTRPFGTTELLPRIVDDFGLTVERLLALRQTWDSNTGVYLPRFGEPIALFVTVEPESAPEDTPESTSDGP
ncbi:MAG: hypothetical protein QNI99_14955 [Woeseiaceae bacterium]|nr:hypothetical protein [Woeseiaceae bacterium]